MENSKVICAHCDTNSAEITLDNGTGDTHICSACCKDSLFDIVHNNESVTILNKGVKFGLTYLEIQ